MADKEAIEQLKRDLRTYGYYKGRIREVESELYNLSQQIKDCYKASGISYGEPMSSSNPKHPRVTSLINEEADLLLERKRYIDDIGRLGIDEKLKVLNDVQLKIVQAIYFDGLSYRFIASQMNYSVRTIQYYNDKGLNEILKYGTRTID